MRNIGAIVLRVVMGLFFIGHGLPKFLAFHATTQELGHLHVPDAAIMTIVVGLVEVVGGVLLVLNRGIRVVTPVLIADSIAIFILHGIKLGFDLGWGWDVVMIAALWMVFANTFSQKKR